MIETPLRMRHDISEGWDFVRGRVSRRWLQGRGGDGEAIDLPHCWNLSDTFQPGSSSYSGKGAYRRAVNLPASPPTPGEWRIRSEGFYGFGDVWLDGRAIAVIDGQYLGIEVGLPTSVRAGRHTVAIRLENLFQRRVLPGRRDPDFLLYGGLAGHVWLEWVPAFRIDESTIDIVCRPGPDGAEIIEIRCRVEGTEASPEKPLVSWVITTESGEQVAAVKPGPVGNGMTTVSTEILNPRCWSPGDPHLYRAEGTLAAGDRIVDTDRVRFGITRAEFRPDQGFFLDGERIDLHGCNRHESIPGLGNALPEELHRADAGLLKDYGCNFVRLSHYPQHPAFLDACDELGILVYAEIASWKSVGGDRAWRRAARRQMHDLILRDRHHPSVILWGMGNESRSRRAYLELREIAHGLDPSRPVTYAENNFHRARREKTVGISDVWGVNYELDVLEAARDASRLRNVVMSECCNHPTSIKGDDREELTQVATMEREWSQMAGRPYLAGHAVWSLTDYATEHRKRYRRFTGLFDAWRRPKMAAELFRARYAAEPFISLFRVEGVDGAEVHAFSNCDRLDLIIGKQTPVEVEGEIHTVVPIDGPFTAVEAIGRCGGMTVCEELRPWGDATTVAITIDGDVPPGRVLPLDLTVLDRSGTPVRDWNGHVTVSVGGDARLFAYTEAGEVLMSRGEGRTYLGSGRDTGEFTIIASAPGLDDGVATVRRRS